MFKEKLHAFGIHLFFSLAIVCFCLFLVLKIWYPAPFFEISGLSSIILILALVDIALGPLMTFFIYNSQKSTLKFDLSVIATIQIAALIYGMHTIYQAHPLYIAYAVDRFTPISANEVSPDTAQYEELKKSKLSSPTIVYVEKPSDPAEMSRVTLEALSGKADLDARPEYYRPFEQHQQTIFADSFNIIPLQEKIEFKIKIEKFLTTHGKSLHDYAFIPLAGRAKGVLWAFSKETGKPVGIIDIDPWNT